LQETPTGITVRTLLILILTLAVATTPSWGQSPVQTSPEATARPGDLIKIEVWREEDMSGEFLVEADGTVVLPLIGEVQIDAIPLTELRQHLLARYRSELRNPSISITPLRRVYVLGEVNEPGLHPVDPTVSLAGAIGIAGGATTTGDLRRIRVIRDGEVILDRVRSESALAALDIRSGDQIFVDRRSWLDRNSTGVMTTLVSLFSLLVVLVR
jgi:protein involved in polysaccharide export with SLBB domain